MSTLRFVEWYSHVDIWIFLAYFSGSQDISQPSSSTSALWSDRSPLRSQTSRCRSVPKGLWIVYHFEGLTLPVGWVGLSWNLGRFSGDPQDYGVQCVSILSHEVMVIHDDLDDLGVPPFWETPYIGWCGTRFLPSSPSFCYTLLGD